MDRIGCGYFGKVPLTGDFIRNGLAETFLRPWDAWLQTAIDRSRTDLGQDWLKYYLTSPVWRFAISGDICGPHPAVGVMMPSVDKVGRYFPLSLAAVVPAHVRPAIVAATEGDWYWKAECAILASLEEAFEISVLDAAVRDIGLPDGCLTPGVGVGQADNGARYGPDSLRIDLGGGDDLQLAYPDMLDRTLAWTLNPYSLWWTMGSEEVDPVFLACRGLPTADRFAAFLDGNWSKWGWDNKPDRAEAIRLSVR